MANKAIIGIVGKHYNGEKQRTDTYISTNRIWIMLYG